MSVKYLGSKRKLIPHIMDALGPHLSKIETACDLMTGTTRVAQAIKGAGPIQVLANDSSTYAYVLARTFVEANRALVDTLKLECQISDLNHLPGKGGWFVERYSREAQFFQESNARRIQAIRDEIDRLYPMERDGKYPLEHSILLTSLMMAADRVDNTCGVQMAYLKHWCHRSNLPITLRLPELTQGSGLASNCDATDPGYLRLLNRNVDLVYIDPPYNQHSYRSNYHIWETLVRWDNPETYGVANKRIDCKTVKSPFNSKPKALPAFTDMIRHFEDVPYLLVSFSNEGYLSLDELTETLHASGRAVILHKIPHNRYIGSRIGVYNPAGEKVGTPGAEVNVEYLLLAVKQ